MSEFDDHVTLSDLVTPLVAQARTLLTPNGDVRAVLANLRDQVVALLDRNNIAFAALTMNKELAITSQQYGLIFGIFFFGYFFFEIPSNLLLHKIGARVWIARILISWGIVAMLTGFVHTVHQLYIVRFLLGLAEAGYFPGMTLYLTYWFPAHARGRAVAGGAASATHSAGAG